MKIIIGGFGRSGTTWLSDIISKCLGGLVLFEPFHPGVFHDSSELIYSSDISQEAIKDHFDVLLSNAPSNPWILRNHLNSPLESHTPEFLQYIWENSQIIGFKTIRGNHALGHLSEIFSSSKLIYIYRHPLAVLSSINKRVRFWDELGWETHEKLFFSRVYDNDTFSRETTKSLKDLTRQLSTKNEVIIAMWSISLLISLQQVRDNDGYSISYEDLYNDPFGEIKALLGFLQEDRTVHPSYLFTPSMTSLRTIHHLRKYNDDTSLDALFWADSFSSEEKSRLMTLYSSILSCSKEVYDLIVSKGYIKTSKAKS